ncbi:MAG: peptide MFS transporter [Hyphomonadaceae bacterium]|nr:peptide MFS transporter [Hyphomonadaceae bacterium]
MTVNAETTVTRGFAGHPKGLFYLAFTEAWERFSYYGMTALVVLYMVNQLLLPGHVENIIGFPAFRATLESAFGAMSTQALASLIFGMYSGFVYFTPVIGGFVADRWIGQRNAVVTGAVLMALGHFAMAFDQSFLVALLLLVIGSGLLKGNISAQVGALYSVDDEARRTRGFAIFSMAINVGAMLGPLVCGLLAQVYGWHVGFGAAAAFLLLGLLIYLVGYRHLPARVEREKGETRKLTAADWRTIGIICAVLVISTFQSTAYFQSFNTALVWIDGHVDLGVGEWQIPTPWFNSVDPVFSILGVPVLFAIWAALARRNAEPDELGKIGIGAWMAAAANLILVAAILVFGNDGLSPLWPFLYYGVLGLAFIWHWPTVLALVSRVAPAPVNSTMMGVAFLTLFVASNVMGWLGGFYEQMAPAAFWAMHAAIAAAGGVAVLIFGRRLSRALKG